VAPVALVHDYLTQRGGAERLVLTMAKAFPGAPLYTSLYESELTFPEFGTLDVRTVGLNRIALLRRRHRLALPLLAPAFSRLRVDAEVAVCSTTGWAHGAHVTGRKIVYCNTPARWLYQGERYLGERGVAARVALRTLRPRLVAWDRAAAASASRYIASSSVVRARIAEIYGIEAEVLPPSPSLLPSGPTTPVERLEPGFFLCVSRLLPYKNVDAVIGAVAGLPAERLVVVGTGPDEGRLRRSAPANVTMLGTVDDAQLRWLYASSVAVVAASHEDFGLTPLEAAAFGRPAAALRWGGFLDTISEHETGVFFDEPDAAQIRAALVTVREHRWDPSALEARAELFSERSYIERIRAIVEEERVALRMGPT
jgi:glycosyltransferase involved in cell wall biosynthesis